VDLVLHFASPASPADYSRLPIDALMVGGTFHARELAREKGRAVGPAVQRPWPPACAPTTDITLAHDVLGWEPTVFSSQGMKHTSD
jgi:nucleoside-diphosphate-sugar epimerase